ncbi:unnamed protein product [Owenia fusiformis]|uniref:protein disulfide-isomerase n=1 Tax=Owenia fusiformis TaxID=6347 RepID=A0A8J1UL17_OWEFU|nr:unnamed protein product [Owenia fusiformis]
MTSNIDRLIYMWNIKMIFVIFLMFFTVSYADDLEDNFIQKLTSEDEFKTYISDNNYVFVVFVDSFDRSKNFMDVFFEISGVTQEIDGVKMALVNHTENKEISSLYKVSRVKPVIMLFKNKRPLIYQHTKAEERTAELLTQWIISKMGRAVKTIKSPKLAKLITEPNRINVIGFFRDTKSKEFQSLEDAAFDTTDVGFYTVQDESIWQENEIHQDTIVLYNAENKESHKFKGVYDADKIQNFIAVHSLDLLEHWSMETKDLFKLDVDFLVAFFPFDIRKITAVKKLAEDYRGSVVFVYVDTVFAKKVAPAFKLVKMPVHNDTVALRFIRMSDTGLVKYKPDEDGLGVEVIKAFIEDVKEGNIEPHKTSGEVPEGWQDKPVKTLVGSTFDQVVKDSSTHRFVEFFAPWCGHCKKLAPIWQEVAEKYEREDKLVFAAVDMMTNDIDVKIAGFPTLLFYEAGSNEPISYKGDRTVEGLSSFIDSYIKPSKEEL